MKLDLNPQQQQNQFARRIVHIDMDAFYASVEQRDNPSLQGAPVIVGGSPKGRGVVAACSYEARKFGVHSAMPCSRAARLCPDAHYIRPNIAKYREVSAEIHTIFKYFTQQIEPLSLDEAYLDLTGANAPATDIAKEIKTKIKSELDLVASAGVSFNKFLAKLASDMDKPDGLFVIRPHQAQAIIDALPVRKFHGIGPVTNKKMQALGVITGADLRRLDYAVLAKNFKSSATYYYQIARGIDTRSVKVTRKRKSIGTETTFSDDITDETEIRSQLLRLAEKVAESLLKKSCCARTITLKFKFSDFKQITRSHTSTQVLDLVSPEQLRQLINHLVKQAALEGRAVRLLGVSCSNLENLCERHADDEYQIRDGQGGSHQGIQLPLIIE